jgi:hypothetical protein
MVKYQIVKDWHEIPGWEYAIERIEDDREPVQVLFNGMKNDAEDWARKMNDLVSHHS